MGIYYFKATYSKFPIFIITIWKSAIMKKMTIVTYLIMLLCLLTFGCKEKTTLDNAIEEQNTITTDLDSEISPIPGFKTVYHMHLKSDEDEAVFVEITGVFNEVVEELGYQNVKFNFWKFTGDIQGKYGYIFESNWPDQKTFDKVFNNEEFKNTLGHWYPKFTSMIAEGVYNRYMLLN